MKRGLDLLPCAVSNSGAIVSVFEYFCLCHSQPVGWTNQFGMAKEQSFLAVSRRKPRPFSLPSDSQFSTMEWHPMGVRVPLCKGLTSAMAWEQKLLPRLHPPASTCQNTQGKTLAVLKWSKQEAAQENKHQLEWRSRVRKKEKKTSGLQTPQILFEEMGWVGGVGGRSKRRDGNFPSWCRPLQGPCSKASSALSAHPCWAVLSLGWTLGPAGAWPRKLPQSRQQLPQAAGNSTSAPTAAGKENCGSWSFSAQGHETPWINWLSLCNPDALLQPGVSGNGWSTVWGQSESSTALNKLVWGWMLQT